mmetsp:Transcript_89769/g.290504  ORF Transcript_89769/g.290504 Transcript_89769/m.290504 type:complete len:207 (+) Transcript_89769:461-1081(+)
MRGGQASASWVCPWLSHAPYRSSRRRLDSLLHAFGTTSPLWPSVRPGWQRGAPSSATGPRICTFSVVGHGPTWQSSRGCPGSGRRSSRFTAAGSLWSRSSTKTGAASGKSFPGTTIGTVAASTPWTGRRALGRSVPGRMLRQQQRDRLARSYRALALRASLRDAHVRACMRAHIGGRQGTWCAIFPTPPDPVLCGTAHRNATPRLA